MAAAACEPHRPGDTSDERCERFCELRSARQHCLWCKCRSCSFCLTSAAAGPTASGRADLSGHVDSSGSFSRSSHRAPHWKASAAWCSAMLRRPTSLFRRMWTTEAFARLKPGEKGCWSRVRDRRRSRQSSRDYFDRALNGSFCETNWFEGHAGPLGEEGNSLHFRRPAPALLGTDASIHSYCLRRLPQQEASSS